MKQDDIVIGGVYWAKVGDAGRKQVEVVDIVREGGFTKASARMMIRYEVKRVDTGKLLPKLRAAATLHMTKRG